jgi:polygalacturonase
VRLQNSAGTSLGHNTDAFDVGSSDHVTVQNVKVYNQDDCVAVNSGTNLYFSVSMVPAIPFN